MIFMDFSAHVGWLLRIIIKDWTAMFVHNVARWTPYTMATRLGSETHWVSNTFGGYVLS